MPASWKDVLKQRDFWIDYFFLQTDPEEWKHEYELSDDLFTYEYEKLIRFPVTDSIGIALEMGEYLPSTSLMVYDQTQPDGILIGQFDDSQPYPIVFRFEEAERLGDYLARHVPEYPSVPYILLSNFMAITERDDLERIHQKTKAAWRQLGLFSDDFIKKEIIDKTTYPIKGLKYDFHPDFGWHWVGEPSYLSFRTLNHPNFPFKLLQDIFDHVGVEYS